MCTHEPAELALVMAIGLPRQVDSVRRDFVACNRTADLGVFTACGSSLSRRQSCRSPGVPAPRTLASLSCGTTTRAARFPGSIGRPRRGPGHSANAAANRMQRLRARGRRPTARERGLQGANQQASINVTLRARTTCDVAGRPRLFESTSSGLHRLRAERAPELRRILGPPGDVHVLANGASRARRTSSAWLATPLRTDCASGSPPAAALAYAARSSSDAASARLRSACPPTSAPTTTRPTGRRDRTRPWCCTRVVSTTR